MATTGAKLSPFIEDQIFRRDEGTAKASPSHFQNDLFARKAVLVLADLLSIWFGGLVTIALRFPLRNEGSVGTHGAFLLLYSGLIILFCNTQNLYAGIQFRSSKEETLAVARAIGLASILLTTFIYACGLKTISRLVIALTMLFSVAAVSGIRYLRRRRRQSAAADGFICRNVLIVGTGAAAQAVHQYLREHRFLGYVPAGFVTTDPDDFRAPRDVLGSMRNLGEIARARFIDEVLISTDNRAAAKFAIAEARACGLSVRVIPDLYDGLAWGAPVEYVGHFPTICLHQKRIPAFSLMLKRGFDCALSAIGLAILSPVIALLALAIKLDSPGPVFYTADRVGRKGSRFGCHKFRTMVRHADRMLAQLQHLNERDGILFKISDDPRITRLGRFLRKYSLDELPQLWNVLKGDMSLVGPRPPIASEVRQYHLDHLKRLDVKPGITGLWQVEARTNPSFASYIALDMEYVDRWNLLLDFRILLKTAAVVVAGTGR
jgi:exopolysaccharide biosynthesis polyprenyl glycosylphosphotransferase